MDIDSFIEVTKYGIETAMMVSAPVLLLALAAGVLVSIVQAATQINDSALAFIPKIAATVGALVIFGPWMMAKMATFANYALNQIPIVTQ
jgi:flagellar biosynthesis protein FliQ